MVEISPTSSYYTNSVSDNKKGNEGGVLAQQDFLTLLTTQLRNQDPLSPMENAEFLGQMAQFSTVEGIDRVNATLGQMSAAANNNSSHIAMAANLLGHSVLVPGNTARPDAEGNIHGAVELPSRASDVVVNYSNVETGETLHSQSHGIQCQGLFGFTWDNVPDSIVENRDKVRITVTAKTDEGSLMLDPSVYAKVTSAIGGPSSPNIVLQVEDYGALDTLEVTAFR